VLSAIVILILRTRAEIALTRRGSGADLHGEFFQLS
jgi:hypothetical protein